MTRPDGILGTYADDYDTLEFLPMALWRFGNFIFFRVYLNDLLEFF